MLLRRGFKAFAEKKSLEFRGLLNLKDIEFLDAFLLAEYLGIKVKCASHFIGDGQEFQNLCSPNSGWSALTLANEFGEKLLIHNTNHSIFRQQSNLMHEIAHIVCEHEMALNPEHDQLLSNLLLRTYNPIQEMEAEILGAALQIPRDGLVKLLYREKNIDEISEIFQASKQMVQFRINNTGVGKQLKRKN